MGVDTSESRARWLGPQAWQRDEGPTVSLGAPGAFDDMHIFAPCVAHEDGAYWLWYCGSRGNVSERVFRLGLAKSTDGVHFVKDAESPVYDFGDGRHSVLTPTLLRSPEGGVLREGGHLRMWFSAATFVPGDPHTLHDARSRDGVRWTPPSDAQLEGAYAPSVIREDDRYRVWYTDVTADPWCFRHAESDDGCSWRVTPEAVLEVDQAWESSRLFYPTVVRVDGVYVMWYGSYIHPGTSRTALGVAVSQDGLRWEKNPGNPVFRPDPSREWESHYTTSQSVIRLDDGSWRIWYASRTKPPFEHKYFAVGTAHWAGHPVPGEGGTR